MKTRSLLLCPSFIIITGIQSAFAASPDHVLTIDTTQKGPEISPTLYGIFFEDINHAVDGGLYAELVRNPSFEYSNPWEGWRTEAPPEAEAIVKLESDTPINDLNHRYVKVQLHKGSVKLINSGYDGIPVEKSHSYVFSIYARAEADLPCSIKIALEAPDGRLCAQEKISGVGPEWEKHQCNLTAVSSCNRANLVLTFNCPGKTYIDMVSLLPEKTIHGMRLDLVKMLEDLKPGFMRFPGGCFVNGDSLQNAFRWKESIGPIEARPTRRNFWGYDHSYSIGLYEYPLLAEHLGAEPLPILNPGISWQAFQSVEVCSLGEMEE